MSAPYLPTPGTLGWNVCQYFRRLPDEELSSKDVALKWQVDSGNVGHQLKLCVEAQLLKRDGTVYSTGPQIDRLEVSAQPFPGAGAQRAAQGRAPVIDIEAIVFDDHVPLTVGRSQGAKLTDRWAAKLETMQPGQSFEVAREQRHSISAAMTRLRKAGGPKGFVSRKSGDVMRVFCVAVEVSP